MAGWYIYTGDGRKKPEDRDKLPPAPPWRSFAVQTAAQDATAPAADRLPPGLEKHFFQVDEAEKALVNAALYLRRPLLVTGPAGSGKSTLAEAVAFELDLGEVLMWPITSRSTLRAGLYEYDAIHRLQDTNSGSHAAHPEQAAEAPPIGKYITLGPLGTALADSTPRRPRVLLIDEIDKSDIDLPNDLLHVFETGRFDIPELVRYDKESVRVLKWDSKDAQDTLEVRQGHVLCREFPLVVLTSNGERELPAPFMRRCLHLEMNAPDSEKLVRIVQAHLQELDPEQLADVTKLAGDLQKRRADKGEYVATDQLLNAVYLMLQEPRVELEAVLRETKEPRTLLDFILRTIGRFER